MSDLFEDQEKFMVACDQTVNEYNKTQFNLYCTLIAEEMDELTLALEQNNKVEVLDALNDILVVTIGAMKSLGIDCNGSWKEVISSNMSKIDKETGKVIKRKDGKVMKPETFFKPNLEKFVRNIPND